MVGIKNFFMKRNRLISRGTAGANPASDPQPSTSRDTADASPARESQSWMILDAAGANPASEPQPSMSRDTADASPAREPQSWMILDAAGVNPAREPQPSMILDAAGASPAREFRPSMILDAADASPVCEPQLSMIPNAADTSPAREPQPSQPSTVEQPTMLSFKEVVETEWQYYHLGRKDEANPLRLLPTGKIGTYDHPNERFWSLRVGVLSFYNTDWATTVDFHEIRRSKDSLILSGRCIAQPAITLCIEGSRPDPED